MNRSFSFLGVLCAMALPVFASAANPSYDLLAPVGPLAGSVTLEQYLRGVFTATIGIAGVLAVIMIVWCGIKTMGNASVSAKSEARTCIRNAIFGLLLAIGSWWILNSINSDLLINDVTLSDITTSPTTIPTPGNQQGNFIAVNGATCTPLPGMTGVVVPPASCGSSLGAGMICCSYSPTPPAPMGNPPPPAGNPPPPAGNPPPPAPLLEKFTLGSGSAYVVENAGFVIITVTKLASAVQTTVDFTTVPGTALPGVNYTTTSGTLTFPPGSTSQTITVQIIDNQVYDSVNKYFRIVLSNPTGPATLGISSKYVYIKENELPPSLYPPVVDITKPQVNGYTVTTGMLNVNFIVTASTPLMSIILTVTDQSTNTVLNTKVICSTTTTLCPATGLTSMEIASFAGGVNGEYSVQLEACDNTLSCANDTILTKNLTGCTATNPACKSDYNALLYCIGQTISGSCAKADLTGDGNIDDKDVDKLLSAYLYDPNEDGLIDPTTTTNNFTKTCFFYTAFDPLLPCALNVYGDITVTATDKTNFANIFNSSLLTKSSINLFTLRNNLCSAFTCTTPGAGIGGTQFLSQYAEAMYTTIAAYDFDGDGTAEWGGVGGDATFFSSCVASPFGAGCAKTDVNRDGYITTSDMNMINNVQSAWSNSVGLLSQMERIYWNGAFQPEAGIHNVCGTAPTPLILLCEKVDYNKDGKITSADYTLLQGVKSLDVNGDGVVIYSQNPLVPISIISSTPPTTSTKFTIGNRIGALTSYILRLSPGNASPTGGTVLASAQGIVSGGPVFADGKWWWSVNYDNGLSGWTIEENMAIATVVIPPPPPPPPPATGLSTKFKMGELVGATDWLTMRLSPSLSSGSIGQQPPLATGNIVGGPVYANGYWWWQVKWAVGGITGWSVQDWMKEYTPPPAPVITTPKNNSYSSSTIVKISGTMPASEVDGTVTVFSSTGAIIGTSLIGTSGLWGFSKSFSDGVYVLTASATDQSLNGGPKSASVTFTQDTVPPLTPVITAPATGAIVTTNTLTFSGSGAEPGNTLYIYNGTSLTNLLGTVIANSSGVWVFTKPSPPDGPYTYAVYEMDKAGNKSPVASRSFIMNAPPPAPTITSPTNGTITAINTVTIKGTIATTEIGATVTVKSGTQIIGSAVVTTGGNWQFTVTLSDGTYSLIAAATDTYGITGANSSTVSLTIDTTPPPTPVITAPLLGSTIFTSSFSITGTGEPGSTIRIYANTTTGILLGSTVVNGAGAWAISQTGYADNSYVIAVTATDKASNVSPPATWNFVVNAPPPPPVVTSPLNSVNTNQTSVTFQGTGIAGDLVEVYEGTALLGSATIIAGGSWTITVGPLSEGPHTLSFFEKDPTLQKSTATVRTLTIDITPPIAPTIISPVNGAVMSSSNVSSNGTGEKSGDTIRIYVNGISVAVGTVNGALKWSVSGTVSPPGTYTFTATETDLAGNISLPSAGVTITVP